MGLHPCLERGCPTLTRDLRCAVHTKPASAHGWREQPRIRGGALQRLRAELFANEPLCRLCVQQGRTRAATIRDHMVPLAEGGTDAPENIQPLCRDCSDIKTREESRRGIKRWRAHA